MPVEEILRRELHEVADGLPVPALPPLPREPSRTRRHWPPLLVAAAVVLIVVAAVAVATSYRDDAGPTLDPAPTPTIRPLTSAPPTVPYVFDDKLYVDGEQVPGSWWEVRHAGDAWVAERTNLTMHWGTGAEPHDIPGDVTLRPHLSPDGTLLAVSTTDGGGQVLLIDTGSGETVNTLPIDAIGSGETGVVAVTDDAQVFLASNSEQLMWLAADDGEETVDLAATAPGQQVEGATPAGLLVFDTTRDGEPDAFYLADASESGETIIVNPSGTWLAYDGSWGGESQTISEITALPVDGGRQLTLQPPGKRILVATTWEDDDLLLAELHHDGDPTGLARCSIREERCVVIDLP